MQAFVLGTACAALVGCGGTVASPGGPVDAAAPFMDADITLAAGRQEAGPPASAFVMDCPRHGAPLAFKLPCLLGWSLTGDRNEPGIHVLECDLRDPPVRTVMGIMVPMVELPSLLNEELHIPFDGLPSVPYALDVVGTAIFTEADPQARTFTGRLLHARVHVRADDTGQDDCTITDQPIWAMPGNFL